MLGVVCCDAVRPMQRNATRCVCAPLPSCTAQERSSYGATRVARLLERSVFSDRMVFVRAVHAMQQLDDKELAIYDSWFRWGTS